MLNDIETKLFEKSWLLKYFPKTNSSDNISKITTAPILETIYLQSMSIK